MPQTPMPPPGGPTVIGCYGGDTMEIMRGPQTGNIGVTLRTDKGRLMGSVVLTPEAAAQLAAAITP